MPAPLYLGLFPLPQRRTTEKEGETGLNNKTVATKTVGKWLLGFLCALRTGTKKKKERKRKLSVKTAFRISVPVIEKINTFVS